MEIFRAKLRLDEIKLLLALGDFSYDKAKKESIKPLKIMNKKGQKVAKKHNMKYRKITFIGYMR